MVSLTTVIKKGKLCIRNSSMDIDNNDKIEISVLYRSHDPPNAEFIAKLEQYLVNKKHTRIHVIIGYFNIDLLNLDNYSQEHLNNLLGNCFVPGFQTITESEFNCSEGSCIDNLLN